MKYNIVFIVDTIHSSPRIHNLANQLSSRGHSVTVLTKRLSKKQKINIGVLFPKYLLRESFFLLSSLQDFNTFFSRESIKLCINVISLVIYNILKPLLFFSHNRWENYDLLNFFELYVNKEFKKITRHHKVDLIISSSSPFKCHVIACKLSKKYSVCWAPDIRDLWTKNHNNPSFDSEQFLFEKTILSQSTYISVATNYFKSEVKNYTNKPIFTLYNGFPSKLDQKLPYNTKLDLTKINLTYTGMIYPNNQNFKFILDVFSRINNRDEYKLNFAGDSCNVIKKHYLSLGKNIPSFINLINKVSRHQAYALQRDSDILLLFDWDDLTKPGIVPTKFFEYLGTKTFILVTGINPISEVAKILKTTKSGMYVSDLRVATELLNSNNFNREEVKSVLNYSYESQSDKYLMFVDSFLNSNSIIKGGQNEDYDYRTSEK